ncbi:MAG: hypothetical protein HY741_10915 [Chloroflexi bacterium]|nr:hypothetical protein [Chloroflexota bacterium]
MKSKWIILILCLSFIGLSACGGAAMPTYEPPEPTTLATAATQNRTPVRPTIQPTRASQPTQVPTSSPNALTEPPDAYPLSEVTITLERTVCFGACPAYSVTIHGDGRVEYAGKQFVRVTGAQSKKIPQQAVIELLREFYRVDFTAFRDEYVQGRDIDVSPDGTVQETSVMVTDLPSTFVTWQVGDFRKRVHAYFGAPADFITLAEKIDAVAGTAAWIK